MNDPQVVALIYEVRHSRSVNYDKAKPLIYEAPGFSVRVENDQARFEMKGHFASVEAARSEVSPFVRQWEVSAALDGGPEEFDLVFKDAEIVDREPDPRCPLCPEHFPLSVAGAEGVSIVGRNRYPQPPTGIVVTANVEAMLARYLRYREGREPIGAMAYFCLTIVNKMAGGRSAAATQLGVSAKVLKRMGQLSGGAGGAEARKADGLSREYTPAERQWLDAAVKMLIRRVANVAAQPRATGPLITMADLPPL
jgi:hypothetical protein